MAAVMDDGIRADAAQVEHWTSSWGRLFLDDGEKPTVTCGKKGNEGDCACLPN